MNLNQMLERAVKRYGGKTAVAMGEHRLSYAELDEASNKVANALMSMGVRKGDRVAMLLPNSPGFVTTYFGVVKVGGVAVPLDTKYKLDELTSLYGDSQPKVLVTESPFLEPLVPVLARFKSIEQVIDLSSKYEGQFLSYQEVMATSPARAVEVELEPADIAHIAYTSGPSFHPRGVMMSHQALVREAAISGDGFQQTDKDVVVLFALPMHHAFGLVVVMLTAIAKGSTVIILPGLSISSLMEVIEREKATIFMGVPFVHGLIVNAAKVEGIRHDLSSLRLWGTAGAAMPAKISEKIKQHFGLTAVDFWGMTESAAHVTCTSLDATGKPGSVGKALPGWELGVVDDEGRELPPNKPGEIVVRGPIMSGYYNNPQATAQVIKGGWLYTGDMGKVDEDGWLFLLAGRKKDMIIAKGQNIYPSDIEEVLHSHPKVAEAAVVGIIDEVRGETPRAVIRLKAGEVATEHEIKRFCLERLANYKVPREFVFTDSLPKAADGKICKEDLR
ncbi:MAG: AMP-binding protein [Dehalococcoidia bacterium]|nr:AMP-binding protein [Dehalococcoidia bacterium]